jgi:serine acetyltransferase
MCVEIEDNCYISTGAKIISSKVGFNSIIGPNAVVFEDIPNNSMVFNSVEYK